MTRTSLRLGAPVAALVLAVACASNPPAAPRATAPRYPDYAKPDVPAALRAPQEVIGRHDLAWSRLQAGDLRGAQRGFTEILRTSQTFYPAEAGLGYVALADRQFKVAATRFGAAIARNDRYLPAWQGMAEAQLGLDNDAQAIAALERIVALDPKQEAAKTRLDLVRFRQLQALIEAGRRARQAGRFDEAEDALERALALSPKSVMILRDLTAVEVDRGDLAAAEAHARQVVQLQPAEGESHASLGAILEARGNYREAAAAYGRAADVDPRWRTRAEALRDRAELAALPPEFRAIPSATTLTRAQVAAYIGIRFKGLVEKAPRRATVVATDVRTHWAAPWILPITQAGIMDVFPNHTFQPSTTVRRGDLARVVVQLMTLAAAGRPAEVAKWRAARPRFVDLPPAHLMYPAAAFAVGCGAMTAPENRFNATRPATGPDLTTALARVEQVAPR